MLHCQIVEYNRFYSLNKIWAPTQNFPTRRIPIFCDNRLFHSQIVNTNNKKISWLKSSGLFSSWDDVPSDESVLISFKPAMLIHYCTAWFLVWVVMTGQFFVWLGNKQVFSRLPKISRCFYYVLQEDPVI